MQLAISAGFLLPLCFTVCNGWTSISVRCFFGGSWGTEAGIGELMADICIDVSSSGIGHNADPASVKRRDCMPFFPIEGVGSVPGIYQAPSLPCPLHDQSCTEAMGISQIF